MYSKSKMNMENIPDEVWQCNVCDELFQSYLELKKLQNMTLTLYY